MSCRLVRVFLLFLIVLSLLAPARLLAAPFLPPADNLAFHLQANRGVVVGSGGVTDWLDQTAAGVDFTVDTSGSNREPTLSANQLNGLPALSFSGDKLLNDDFEFGVGQTVFVVIAGNNVQSSGQRYMGHFGDGQLRYQNVAVGTDGGYLGGWFGHTMQAPEESNIAVTNGEFAVATYQFNTDNVLVSANGNPFVVLKATSPSFSPTSSLSIGAVGNNGPSFSGRIAEVLVYDKALDTAEVSAVGQYLHSKYQGPVRPEVIPYATTNTDSQYPTAVLYHLDGNALDSSGNNLHLARHGGAGHDVWVEGPAGLDLATGPIDSLSRVLHKGNLSAAEVGAFNTKTFTIEAWVRNPGLEDTDQNPIFYYRSYQGGNSRLDLVVTTAGRLELRMNRDDTGNYQPYATTDPLDFVDDTWYHIAVTYDNNDTATVSDPNDSTLRFYMTPLDDFGGQALLVEERTGIADIKPLTAGGNLILGGADYAVNRLFGGDIDQLRYVNRVLLPHEFNLAMPAPEPTSAMLVMFALVALAGVRTRRRQD